MPGIRHLGHARPLVAHREGASMLAGAAWMVAIGLLLYWLPVVNGIVGGLVGGSRIASTGRALLVAIVPAAIVAAGEWTLVYVLGLPVLGVFADTTPGMATGYTVFALFVGAGIAGSLAETRRRRRRA